MLNLRFAFQHTPERHNSNRRDDPSKAADTDVEALFDPELRRGALAVTVSGVYCRETSVALPVPDNATKLSTILSGRLTLSGGHHGTVRNMRQRIR